MPDMTADPTHQRITYRPEGAARGRSIILANVERITVAGHSCTMGDRVGAAGAPTGEQHIVADTLISKRVGMVMDNHYGKLVQA